MAKAKPLRVLIVEDSEDDALLVIRELERGGYDTTFERVETAEAMTAALENQAWDIILADYHLPHFSAPEALELFQQSGLDFPFIVISGTIGEETAVATMKAGAHDYLMKGKLTRLVPAIERELHEAEVRQEHKKAEVELLLKDLVFEQSITANSIADKAGIITHVNSTFLRTWGYTNEKEAIGKPISDFLKFESDAMKIVTALNETGEWQGGYTALRKDGTTFSAYGLGTVIPDESGDTIGYQSAVLDITERKQTEEELSSLYEELKALNLELEERVKERTKQLEEAVQAAEVANRAKSDFLASMSHELRTPLNAVIGFSQVLQEQYFGKLNEKQTEYVTDIMESGQHLLSLINDILDLSKIEVGKMELELSGVKIKDLLESSLVMVKEKALVHRIDLDIDTTGDLEGLEIMADERRIKQVVFNLLSNATKFTPDGGTITIKGRKEGKELIISVSDTGIGIAPEEQEKVFEEFYQTSGTIKDKTPGTGLGLPVTKSIVEMHAGRIWVESEGPDKGSRFTFTLPI